MAGKRVGVANIVGGVVNGRRIGEAGAVNQEDAECQRENSRQNDGCAVACGSAVIDRSGSRNHVYTSVAVNSVNRHHARKFRSTE